MKVRAWVPIAGFVLLGLIAAASAQTPASGSMKFRFAFGALTGSGQNQQLKPITQDTALGSGDRVKLMLELQQPGFVYLVHRGSQGDINLLFPPDLKQAAQVGQKYYVPSGSNWFKFDQNIGTETFYLLASSERQTSLETLLTRYQTAPAAGKAAAATDIQAEIRRLRSERQTATPDRAGIIGGNVRSLDSTVGPRIPDVETIAAAISVTGFYGRTFTIEHR